MVIKILDFFSMFIRPIMRPWFLVAMERIHTMICSKIGG